LRPRRFTMGKDPTKEQIYFSFNSIQYEIWMLRESFQLIIRSSVNKHNDETYLNRKVLLNVSIENFAVHARNLIEFFSSERDLKPRFYTIHEFPETDIQFTGDDHWRRINNQISHIDKTRGEQKKLGTKGEWNIIRSRIEEQIKIFTDDLKPEFKSRLND